MLCDFLRLKFPFLFLLFSLGFFLKAFFESLNTIILFCASSKEKSGICIHLSTPIIRTLLLRIHKNERGVENVLRPSNALGGDERQPGPDGRHERAAGAVGRRRGLRGVLDDRYDLMMMFGMCGVLCLV